MIPLRRIPSNSQPTGHPSSAPLSKADVRNIFYGLMLGMFLSALNQTIVATALPTIGRDLGNFMGNHCLSALVHGRVTALR